MYVLPLSVLLERLNLSREQVIDDVPITIPSSLLRFLVQIVLLESDFSEDGYLDANPDLQGREHRCHRGPRGNTKWGRGFSVAVRGKSGRGWRVVTKSNPRRCDRSAERAYRLCDRTFREDRHKRAARTGS